MGLEGQLQQMSFGEIFQTISLCKQSGVLSLTGNEGKMGRLIFSQGRLLGASVGSLERFGESLVQKEVITEEELGQALTLQRTGTESLPFGEVLRKMGLVSDEALQVELKKYLVEAVQTLLRWKEGSFCFEFGPASNTQGRLLDEGLDLPSLLIEATGPKDVWQQGLLENVESQARRGEWPHFLSMLSELFGPINQQEVVLLVLRYASEIFHRTVLFIVKEHSLLGAGQSGLPFSDEEADRRIKGLRIALSNSSLFKEVMEKKENYRGVLSSHAVHQSFIDQIGQEWPPEIFLAPLLAGSEGVALLYGDQTASGVNLPDTRGLEAFIRIANMISTKILLEKKLLARRGS